MTENKRLRTTVKTVNGDSVTPILLFRRMQGTERFLLESSSHKGDSGRYSFLGMNPVKAYRGKIGKIEERDYRSHRTYEHTGDLYTLLKRLMPRISDDIDFPLTGGAVGYVGYGAAREGKERLADDLQTPDVYFNIYDTMVIFDHVEQEVTILHTEINPVYGEPNLDALEEMLFNGKEQTDATVQLSPYTSTVSQEVFEQQVQQALDEIEQGRVEQVVLSRRLEAEVQGDPFMIYRKLRKSNPSPYMYYMEFDDHTVIGASPESLVRVKDGLVTVNPIAGTRKRGETRVKDLALEQDLRSDQKELAEHQMLVELSTQEMEAICEAESIQVTKEMETVRYEHVMHLVSEIEGQLAQGLHALDALKATLPAGTVTGSPKPVAMTVIDEIERRERGIYGGAIGYIGLNGNIDFALTIRTMVIKNQTAYVQAGAGVVAGSTPLGEYQETVNKSKSLLHVLAN